MQIRDAIDFARALREGEPENEIVVPFTITDEMSGRLFVARGDRRPVFRVKYRESKAPITILGARDVKFADFELIVDPAEPKVEAIAIETDTKTTVTGIVFDNIRIQGVNGGFTDGISTSGAPLNGSEITYRSVQIFNFLRNGIALRQPQAKSHNVYGCDFNGVKSAGSAGISTWCTSDGQGGAFNWFGGNISNVEVALRLGSPNDPIIVNGLNTEGCRRLLVAAGPTSGGSAVTVAGVRFAKNRMVDSKAIDFQWGGGSLTMEGCTAEPIVHGQPAMIVKHPNAIVETTGCLGFAVV